MDVRSRLGVEALLVVANTRHGPGGHRGLRARPGEPMHDHLADPADACRFLLDHGVEVPSDPPDTEAFEALRLIRGHVRALAGDPELPATDEGVPAPAARSGEAEIRALFERHPIHLDPDGALTPAGEPGGWNAFVADLLPPLVSIRRDRDRLRLCGNPQCRFLFLDRSRNASRVWCEMAVCGNRARGRRHRLRRLVG